MNISAKGGILAPESTGKHNMRVCDRHPRKKATKQIHFVEDDAWYDLCESCLTEIAKFISNVKKESVEGKRGFFGKKTPA